MKTKQVTNMLVENKDFIAKLQAFLGHYTITTEEEVEELDYLVEPYFKLEIGKTVISEIQGMEFELKRTK